MTSPSGDRGCGRAANPGCAVCSTSGLHPGVRLFARAWTQPTTTHTSRVPEAAVWQRMSPPQIRCCVGSRGDTTGARSPKEELADAGDVADLETANTDRLSRP